MVCMGMSSKSINQRSLILKQLIWDGKRYHLPSRAAKLHFSSPFWPPPPHPLSPFSPLGKAEIYSQPRVSDSPSVRVLALPEETLHKHTYLISLTTTGCMPCAVKTVFKQFVFYVVLLQSNRDFRKGKKTSSNLPTQPPVSSSCNIYHRSQ